MTIFIEKGIAFEWSSEDAAAEFIAAVVFFAHSFWRWTETGWKNEKNRTDDERTGRSSRKKKDAASGRSLILLLSFEVAQDPLFPLFLSQDFLVLRTKNQVL